MGLSARNRDHAALVDASQTTHVEGGAGLLEADAKQRIPHSLRPTELVRFVVPPAPQRAHAATACAAARARARARVRARPRATAVELARFLILIRLRVVVGTCMRATAVELARLLILIRLRVVVGTCMRAIDPSAAEHQNMCVPEGNDEHVEAGGGGAATVGPALVEARRPVGGLVGSKAPQMPALVDRACAVRSTAHSYAARARERAHDTRSRARAFIPRAELAALVVPPGEHEPDAGYARHVLVAHRHCSDRVAPEPWLAARRRAQVTVDRPPPHPKKVPHAIVRSERGSRPTHELCRLFGHYCCHDGQRAVQWAACDD